MEGTKDRNLQELLTFEQRLLAYSREMQQIAASALQASAHSQDLLRDDVSQRVRDRIRTTGDQLVVDGMAVEAKTLQAIASTLQEIERFNKLRQQLDTDL